MFPLTAHSLLSLSVSVVCFDASHWGRGQSPGPEWAEPEPAPRTEPESESPVSVIWPVTGVVWHHVGDITSVYLCWEASESAISPSWRAVTTSWLKILVSLTPYGKLYAKSDLDSLRICLFWVENKNQKVCLYLEWDTELEILDLAPEIGFLRFMVSV